MNWIENLGNKSDWNLNEHDDKNFTDEIKPENLPVKWLQFVQSSMSEAANLSWISFLADTSFGLLSLPLCVCVCVCLCLSVWVCLSVCQSLACPRDKPKMQKTLVKVPIICGLIDLDVQGQI